MSTELNTPLKPLDPPTGAPAWVALVAAWVGLLSLGGAIVFVLLPGSRSPRAELERLSEYSPADRFVPVPLYGGTIAIFLGIVVMWQARRLARPLPEALRSQRVQACVGIALGILAACVVYIDVAIRRQ
ncbi:MAG: hypothetical protein ACREJC_21145 [Tepidisphaeraceae bacterium]